MLRQLKEGMQPGMGDSTVPDRAGSVCSELPGDPGAVSGLKERLGVYLIALQVELYGVGNYAYLAKKEENPGTVQVLLEIAKEEKKHFNSLEERLGARR